MSDSRRPYRRPMPSCSWRAALLHDVGHWPFGHPIEDLRLAEVPRHEELARRASVEGEVSELLRSDWRIEPAEVADLLAGRGAVPKSK